MIFKRFYDSALAQASFLIGCTKTQKALVVDPRRDYQVYRDYAKSRSLELTSVVETHIHADFLSGARELAAAIGAKLIVSDEGGDDWRYRGLESFDVRRLQDGERFAVGTVQIEALHTPGHTPEHLSLIVFGEESNQPVFALTGDFFFANTLGRPDLLETTGLQENSGRPGAEILFHSIRRFIDKIPRDIPVWPGHGAGSACGKSLGERPCTTIGYELRTSAWAPYVRDNDQEGFIAYILRGQPETPTYFKRMKKWNRDGFPLQRVQRRAPRLTPEYFSRAIAEGALAVDLRPRLEFARSHIKDSLSLPESRELASLASWILPELESLIFVTDEHTDVDKAAEIMLRVGQDEILGFIPFADLEKREETVPLPAVEVEEAFELWEQDRVQLIDVRSLSEFESGHIPGAQHVPIAQFTERYREIPRDNPLLVYCTIGLRSAVAASFLQKKGYQTLRFFQGSMETWRGADKPVEKGAPSPELTRTTIYPRSKQDRRINDEKEHPGHRPEHPGDH